MRLLAESLHLPASTSMRIFILWLFIGYTIDWGAKLMFAVPKVVVSPTYQPKWEVKKTCDIIRTRFHGDCTDSCYVSPVLTTPGTVRYTKHTCTFAGFHILARTKTYFSWHLNLFRSIEIIIVCWPEVESPIQTSFSLSILSTINNRPLSDFSTSNLPFPLK